ncbi:hypothetical protein J4E85_009465 [Alternaria conjuncta]|uniref:uncharacterized protein n=1 Tax=Alternaria conjuncta TaxID=181017 RepID=UPI0022210C6E|nr:uncharacterized protein J4E85_009465 [Alternaria conjuncta]KAI4919208.1 hypothetical protein J4E85_009465 [Alternaria conjuncta]
MSPITFTRDEVQDMLDRAQLNAGHLFANLPDVRELLQTQHQESLMECNSRGIDQMKVLHQSMHEECKIIDGHNKHRLGKARTAFNDRVIDPMIAVEYREEENIPADLRWYPLHAEVAIHDGYATAHLFDQPESDEEDYQNYPEDQPAFIGNGNESPIPVANQDIASSKIVKRKPIPEGRKSTGPGSPKYDKLKDAPSAWLDLPHGNLTLAETLAFIPHAIKSFDIMDRFLHNGALSGTFADMINHYRDMPYGPITNNTVYRMMKGPMLHRAKTEPTYEDWTVSKHTTLPKPAGFNPTSVSVAGFAPPYNFNSRERAVATTQSPPSIPFREMANGVKIMPSGRDALDLTRCVQYCVKNNDSSWQYPQDFQNLVARLGGASTVHPHHHDDAAIRRHTSEKKRNNAKRAGARQRDRNGRLMKQPKGFVVDSDEEELLDEEYGEESEADLENFDFDALDIDDNEPLTATKKGSSRKNVIGDDTSDEDELTPRTRNSSKRKRTSNKDDEDTPPRQKSKQSKKTSPRTPARRSTRTRSSSRLSKEVVPEALDSDSDSDAYAGPKKRTKKAKVSTRSSPRGQRFGGSYNFKNALNGEEDEENEEDESEVEYTPASNKRILTPAEMRMVGRTGDTGVDNVVKDDESDMGEDDEDFDCVPLIGSELTTMLPPAVNVPQSSRPVTTPADEYARLTRRQQRDAREKRRIQKAARAARDELYRARQVVKDAQEVARAARLRASRYSYIPAPRNTRAVSSTPHTVNVKAKKSKSKSAGSVHSAPMDMDETWSWIKDSSSAASQNGSAHARH